MVLLYLLFVIVIFYWQLKKAQHSTRTKGKAIGLYAAYIISPVVLYGIVFLGLVGVEELTSISIIGETYARSLIFVIAGGLVVSLFAIIIFSLFVFVLKRKQKD